MCLPDTQTSTNTMNTRLSQIGICTEHLAGWDDTIAMLRSAKVPAKAAVHTIKVTK